MMVQAEWVGSCISQNCVLVTWSLVIYVFFSSLWKVGFGGKAPYYVACDRDQPCVSPTVEGEWSLVASYLVMTSMLCCQMLWCEKNHNVIVQLSL